MTGINKILGIGLGILTMIGALFGIKKRRTRKKVTMKDVESSMNELYSAIDEWDDDELTKMIEEMTKVIEMMDDWVGINDCRLADESELKITRFGNGRIIRYQYQHGEGGLIYHMSEKEKKERLRQLLDILSKRMSTPKTDP